MKRTFLWRKKLINKFFFDTTSIQESVGLWFGNGLTVKGGWAVGRTRKKRMGWFLGWWGGNIPAVAWAYCFFCFVLPCFASPKIFWSVSFSLKDPINDAIRTYFHIAKSAYELQEEGGETGKVRIGQLGQVVEGACSLRQTRFSTTRASEVGKGGVEMRKAYIFLSLLERDFLDGPIHL